MSDPFNDRLSVTVGSDGRFSEGAFPDPSGTATAGSFTTLYGWPSTGTSYTTVRVDGVDHVFGSSDGTFTQAPTDGGTFNDSSWDIGGVTVTQHLELVTNPDTGKQDTAAIRYTTVSNDVWAHHNVGVRVMLDTDVNNNDGASFRVPGLGAITTERDMSGTSVPNNFQVFQDLSDSAHIASATLRGGTATPPDRLVIGTWPGLWGNRWDYTTTGQPVTNDSAYAAYWNPVDLGWGQSRTTTTYYGLSSVTVDLAPPLALGLAGPATLVAVDGGYSPSPFTVTATVSDSGTADLTGVALTLNLPSGFHTTSPTQTTIGPLTIGEGEREFSWPVTVDAQNSAATFAYSVTASATNSGSKTVARSITVPPTTASLPDTYVSMGDSFQSGEGAYFYEPRSDTDTDRCHRSLNSYASLLSGELQIKTTSVACSGAHIKDLAAGMYHEDAQYKPLTAADSLVTIGIGGNDLGFADTITACAEGPALSGDFFSVNQTCHGRFDKTINDGIARLETKNASPGLSPLQTVYDTIRKGAPRARIIVVGYPHFFEPTGNWFGCNLIYPSDQVWINAKIDQFDDAIRRQALSMGAEYAAGANEFDGHELCGAGIPYMNGIIPVASIPLPRAASESFHPNVDGHKRIAELLLKQIRTYLPTNSFPIDQSQTVTTQVTVNPGQLFGSFFSQWPGSEVQMTLTDPAGKSYTRADPGDTTFHSHGPTTELFQVPNPAPGIWTVSLYGAQINPSGETVNFTFSQAPVANKLPVAVATQKADGAGTTVTYDATGSSDPDGTIVGYQWDFGDGTTATGRSATHVYRNLGSMNQPTLIVTDNGGYQGFLALNPVKVHYGFDGFRPPVGGVGPIWATAGQAIPFKWALKDPDGKSVTSLSVVNGYAFDVPGATFTLKYDPDGQQFIMIAKTPKSWAGTTRTFTLRLADQSVHTVTVKF